MIRSVASRKRCLKMVSVWAQTCRKPRIIIPLLRDATGCWGASPETGHLSAIILVLIHVPSLTCTQHFEMIWRGLMPIEMSKSSKSSPFVLRTRFVFALFDCQAPRSTPLSSCPVRNNISNIMIFFDKSHLKAQGFSRIRSLQLKHDNKTF